MLDILYKVIKNILNDLRINSVRQEITLISKRYQERLQNHLNTLASSFLTSDKFKFRKLKNKVF